MNKEQMLEILNNIQEKIKEENLDDYNIDNRVAEIENIKEQISALDARIRFLSDKVLYENNYRNVYFALNDEALRYDLNKNVLNSNIEIENNKKIIAELNEDIAKANETIGSANLEIRSLEEDALINGQLLRGLGENPNNEEEQIIKEDLNSIRSRIEYLKENNERLSNAIIDKNEKLIQANNKTQELVETNNKAKEELNSFDDKVVNTPIINEAKRKADINELETIRHERNELAKREKVLSLDYTAEFARITDDLRNDIINVEEASRRVGSVVNNIPEGYFIEDLETREKELNTNRKKQLEVSDRIKRLEKKLQNEEQYTVSAFVAERNNTILRTWETKLAGYNTTKEELIKKERELESELRTYESMVQDCDRDIALKGEELRSFGNNISNDDENKIQEDLRNLRREKQEAQNEVNETNAELINNANQLLEVENKIERTNNIVNNLKNSLNDRNTIDRSEIRLDEQKLSAAVETLAALKNREKFIEKSVAEVMDQGIGVKGSETKEDLPFAPEMSTTSPEDKETTRKVEMDNNSLVDSINKDLKDRGINAKVNVNNDTEDNINSNNEEASNYEESNEEQDFTNPEITNEENEMTSHEEETEEKQDFPAKKRFKHKFKEAKESLVRKAKSAEFKNKLFKYAKKVTAVVAILAVTVGGAKMCGTIMEKIKNPVVTEQTDPQQIIDEEKENINNQEIDVPAISPEESVDEKEEVNEEVNEDKYEYYKKPSTNTTNTNSSNNNNSNSSNNNSNDNSDDISVPETPVNPEEPNVEPDTPVTAPDAEIEDNNTNDEEINVDDAEKEDENITVTPEDGNITITPDEDEDITIEDAEIEDTNGDNIFDNKDEVEDSLNDNQDEDITIEDAETENNNGNIEPPKVEDENITIEDAKDDLVTTPVEPPVVEEKETIEVEVNKEESLIIPTTNGPVYEYDNSNNLYENINKEESKNITENVGTESIKTGDDKDTITFTTESIEREHELTKEELQQLREEFANMTGNDLVTDETKSR